MTSCKTLEFILVFSIVDAILDQKGTTIATNRNDCNKNVRQEIATNRNDCNKKVRQENKKSGKISGKNPGEIEGTTWKTRPSFNEKFMTKKTSHKDHKKYIIKTRKTSHIDCYKLNSIFMIKCLKIFVTAKVV